MRLRGPALPALLLVPLCILSPASAGEPALSLSAERWFRADSLFTRDPRWLGGDLAATVELGGGRILWLFGDCFIGTDSTRSRARSVMVHNTVAIQQGRDPTSARIRFCWDEAGSRPRSFFADGPAHRVCPVHGVLLPEGLVVFALKVRSVNAGLGFDNFGVAAIHVSNPDEAPERWRARQLDVPVQVVNGEGIAGIGAVLADSGFLYAWFTYDDQRQNAYLARWPLPFTARWPVAEPEWWTAQGWAVLSGSGPRPLRQLSGATDFSVQPLDSAGGLLLMQTVGFGQARVCYRTADRITGPWSDARYLHTPAEFSVPEVIIYSANGHPELAGGEFVITYNVNSLGWAELIRNRDVYFPKFLRARQVPDGVK